MTTENRRFLASDLSQELGLPRSTINDWLTRYAEYLESENRGKRRFYSEKSLQILREIAELRNAGNSSFEIEQQLAGSKYGIAYTDGTEHITQLNRSLENNLLKTVEYLTNMAYSQLGITPEIMNGTASDAVMTNYENRTIEPIVAAAVDEIRRKFLTEDDRANRESVMYFRDPFKLTPVSAVAEMADKFTRNEIMTSNEFRQAIGMKPSKDPKADELRNANISQSSEEIAAQNKTITAGRDAVERSIANQNG